MSLCEKLKENFQKKNLCEKFFYSELEGKYFWKKRVKKDSRVKKGHKHKLQESSMSAQLITLVTVTLKIISEILNISM